MKLMTTNENNEQRMRTAIGKLSDFSKKCQDFLTDSWGVHPDSAGPEPAMPLGTLMLTGDNTVQAVRVESERAMLQLSERLGAGNYLPALTEWHNKTRNSQMEKKAKLRGLWNHNVSALGELHKGQPLLFRTYGKDDGPASVRAVLSNQYVVLNNYELLASTAEQVQQEAFKNEVPLNQISFDYEMNEEMSDVRFYFINDNIRFDDNYRGGIVVKNGECGDSSFDVQLILFNTACANVIRTQIHYGVRHMAERVFRYSDLTNRIHAELVYRTAGEMTRVLLNRSQLQQYYEKLILSRDIALDVDKAQIIMRRAFSQQRVDIILSHWKTDEEKSMYGLAQAITLKAQDVPFDAREKEEEFAARLVFA